MECLWLSIVRFFKVLWSYIVAVARLIVWTFVFFFVGLQRTLFMRSEIAEVDFKVTPLRCDTEAFGDKMAYIDKLYMENPDFIEGMIEEDIPFDDIMDDNGENGETDL